MSNLIAYIPVLNNRHVEWFKKHSGSKLWLISQEMAQGFDHRLARNIGAISTEMMLQILTDLNPSLLQSVQVFDPNKFSFDEGVFTFADEDVSHAVEEKHFPPRSELVSFEMIWARYDMRRVSHAHQVVPNVVISSSVFDITCLEQAIKVSKQSPDWWRQVGACLYKDGVYIVSCNTHLPHDYETYIFGDPRINYDAGQPGKYVALHGERAVIAKAARLRDFSTVGASLYVTTFPCVDCAREVAFAGITKLYYKEGYSSLNALEVLEAFEVEIIQVVEDPVPA